MSLISLLINALVSIVVSLFVWNLVGLPLVIKIQENQIVRYVQVVKYVTVTAYSPRTQETDSTPTITAIMTPVKQGGIAVSRDLLYAGWTFGRRIYLPGIGVFKINDVMSDSKRAAVDIFMFSHKEAIRFGRKNVGAVLITGDLG